MPLRVVVTSGTVADCKLAKALINGFEAEHLLADRGYDSNTIVQLAINAGMNVVIPPRKNRIVQREYDSHIYKVRHLVENAFLWIKRWRSVATRYAKNTSSFLAIVQIACLVLWLKIF